MKKFQHSLVIGADTWHGRWYRYWLSLGGKQPKYKENLCHYVRVLLIWAPLRWFFRGSLGKARITPWAVALIGAFFTAVGVSFFIWGRTAIHVYLIGDGIAVAIVICLVLLGIGAELAEDHNWDRKCRRFFKKTGDQAERPFVWAWSKIGKFVEATCRWFFTHSYVVPGLAPVTVCIVAGLTVFAILAMHVFLIVLLAVGGAIAAICLFMGLIWSLFELNDRGKLERLKKMWPWFRRFVGGTSETVKLGVTYANTKKQGSRICPFIELNEPDTESSS